MKRHFHHLLAPSVNTMGNYRVIVTGIFISFCLLFYMGTFAHGAELTEFEFTDINCMCQGVLQNSFPYIKPSLKP